MITITGRVNRITYRNEDNGYAIFNLMEVDGKVVKCLGNLSRITEGLHLEVQGEWDNHPKWGKQLKLHHASEVENKENVPHQIVSLVPGLTLADAMRVTKILGDNALDIISKDPGALKGLLPEKRAEELYAAVKAMQKEKEAYAYFLKVGVPLPTVRKVVRDRGTKIIPTLQENIYLLAVWGYMPFKELDELSPKMGISKDNLNRLNAAVLCALYEALGNGHLYLPDVELVRSARTLLGESPAPLQPALDDLNHNLKIIRTPEDNYYLDFAWEWETDAATRLAALMTTRTKSLTMPPDLLNGMELAPEQQKALDQALTEKVMVITGNPGTGKCVAMGTRVLSSRGLVPIEELAPVKLREDQHYPLSVQVETLGGPAPTQAFYNGGIKPTLRLTTNRGYSLVGTLAHPVLTATPQGPQWKKMADLSPGDYIALNVSRTTLPITDKISKDEAWLLGALIADGCFVGSMVTYTKANEILRQEVLRILKAEWGVTCSEFFIEDKTPFIHLLDNANVRRKLHDLGVEQVRSEFKRVPRVVFESGPEVWESYLKGLFQHDGHFGKYFEWSTASKQHAYEVMDLLAALGIWVALTSKEVEGRPYYRIGVTGKDLLILARTVLDNQEYQPAPFNTNVDVVPSVGNLIRSVFTSAGKQPRREWTRWRKEMEEERRPSRDRVNTLLANRPNSPAAETLAQMTADNIRWDRVASLDNAGQQQVYDLSVPEGGACFVANSFHVHNTFITQKLLEIFRHNGLTCQLMAPTGKAAARLKEVTGRNASTIHRALGATPQDGEEWEVNPGNLLKTDVVLVDEFSMVDSHVFYRLMRALPSTTRLILVGDADQLPPVGPGLVFVKLLESNLVPTVRLNRIYRQAEGSLIIRNAHRINSGQPIETEGPKSDFVFVECQNPEDIQAKILTLAEKAKGKDAIVLTPTNLGPLGVDELNRKLQGRINPDGDPLVTYGTTTYRKGDRVLVTKNNYDLKVLNGEMGVVSWYDDKKKLLHLVMDSGDPVAVPVGFLENMKLGYAITVHKSQGSQFEIVISPIHSYMHRLLYRSLLYTDDSRARSKMVLIGQGSAVMKAINTVKTENRNTQFNVYLGKFLDVQMAETVVPVVTSPASDLEADWD